MNRALLVVAYALATALLMGAASTAQEPCTITVDRGTSIQTAIDAAPEGAVVCLPAGSWQEHVTVIRSLTLRGAGGGRTRLHGHEIGRPVIHVNADVDREITVEFAGLTVTGGTGSGGYGLSVEGSAEITIRNCAVYGCRGGIRVGDRATAWITGCTISENGVGIGIWGSAQAVITGCVVDTNDFAIELGARAEARVEHCSIFDNFLGVLLRDEAVAFITDARISGTAESSIFMEGTSQATVVRSTLSDNYCGVIVLTSSSEVRISESVIAWNEGAGILLQASASLELSDSAILGNRGYGVSLFEPQCYEGAAGFSGAVSGSGNRIPGPNEEEGNQRGVVCPDVLGFLLTDEGGELDWGK